MVPLHIYILRDDCDIQSLADGTVVDKPSKQEMPLLLMVVMRFDACGKYARP